jgi:hypothetical protein
MEGKRDSECPDIMSHPVDSEAWEALDCFDPEFISDPRSIRLGLSRDGSNLTMMPTVHILAGLFLSCLIIYR